MKNLKRIVLLLATVMMFFALTACSSQPTTPSVTTPAQSGSNSSNSASSGNNSTNSSSSEIELVNQNGVKITLIGGLDLKGSYFGPRLKLRIENNSGHDITVQSRKTSVNGYTLGDFGATMSADVLNGQKAYDYFTLSSSKLEDAGITTIHEIKTSFHVFNSDTWDTDFDTELVTIKF